MHTSESNPIKRKLLLYADYFFPDVAATSLLYTELCEDLSDDFEITVICTVPCYIGTIGSQYKNQRYYFEDYKGIHIIRIQVPNVVKTSICSRAKHILTYYYFAKKLTRSLRPQDVIIAVSSPPILGGMLGAYGKKKLGCRLLYNVHDFNPEQAEITGYVHNRLILSMSKRLDNRSCKRSDCIILDTKDMQDTLKKRFHNRNTPASVIISNWVDLKKVFSVNRKDNPLFDKLSLPRENFYVSYAGNIGIMQDLPTVIKAAEILKNRNPRIQLVFIGDGVWKNEMTKIIEEKELNNVLSFPMQPANQDPYIYSLGDIEIVSIGRSVTQCSMPSKTWKICAAGRPIICQADMNSSLASLMKQGGWGVCVEPGNPEVFAQALLKLYQTKESLSDMGKKARAFAEENLSRETVVNKYRKILNKLFEEV